MISCAWRGRIILEDIDSIFLVIIGVSIIIYCVFWIAKGGLKDGVRTIEYGTYTTPHIAADFVTAALCIASGIAIFLGFFWGLVLGLFASGMLLYVGINGLNRGLIYSKSLSVVFVVVAVFSLMIL
ncbi:MAG: hypothetical protein ACTSWF_01215 [Candidatus Freyarchaeota archaeon]